MNWIKSFSFLVWLPLYITLLVSCKDDVNRVEVSEVTAEFTVDATDILTGNGVNFEDQSSGDVTHWSWIFEGGTPEKSSEQNPTVTYNESGSFEVKLVVSNARYTDEVVKSEYITVTKTPQPVTTDFSADKVSILSGESIVFTDESDGGATEWAWEFISESGSIMTSSDQNPEVTFEDPGVYSVKLTASNSQYSDEELKEGYVTVVDASSVAADFSTDTRLTYSGQEITFTDLSVGTVTNWEWTFEGGTPSSSTEQNPVITYNSAGKYKVTLTASNDSNTSTEEKVGYITVIPGDDLLALLPFSGSKEDAGPLNLPVENSSGSVTFTGTDRAGSTNAAAVFDGNGILKIPAIGEKQLGTSGYSIGIWLKTSIPSQMMIWEEGGGGAGLPQAWLRINDNASDKLYRFNVNTGPIINVGVGDGASALSDNSWHHVVCVRDASGSARIYVDGSLVKERDPADIGNINNDLGFILGGQDHNDAIINLYTGQLDDLVIYKRVLSDEEITLLSEQ